MSNEPKPKVIFKLKNQYHLPYIKEADKNITDADFKNKWISLLNIFPDLKLNPVFTCIPVNEIITLQHKALSIDPTYKPADFTKFFECEVSDNFTTTQIKLLGSSGLFESVQLLTLTRTASPVSTPGPGDISASQVYLDMAPAGVDIRIAWAETGGDGAGINFIDIEHGWNFSHPDLNTTLETLLHGVNYSEKEHGTNVLGVVGAVDNGTGCIGMAYACNMYAVGSMNIEVGPSSVTYVHRPADAILFAIRTLGYGDVLLIELQTGDLIPIEEVGACFEAIRLGTALGIVIIELGGNANNDLDTYKSMRDQEGTYHEIFDIRSAFYRDSGAIMVGGVDHATTTNAARVPVAGSRVAAEFDGDGSNFGSRINCFARYNGITTTGPSHFDLDPSHGIVPGEYTNTFNGTSGASAIIAGLVISLQGILQNLPRGRMNSWQMRNLLSFHDLGTESFDPGVDRVNVMPDLKKIIDRIKNPLNVDVFIRDNLTDIGDRHTGVICRSPDIFTLNGTAAADAIRDPQGLYGQRSVNENNDSIGEPVIANNDNYIFTRVKNRGTSDAYDVRIQVFFSEVSTLITPYDWKYIGETNIPALRPGEMLVADPILWNNDAAMTNPIPASGHYCYICIIGNTEDPMPIITTGLTGIPIPPSPLSDAEVIIYTWDDFYRIIRDNNNITWRNFNVIEITPYATSTHVEFMMAGAPDREIEFEINTSHDLPENTKLTFEFNEAFARILARAKLPVYPSDHNKDIFYLELKEKKINEFTKLILPPKFKAPCKLNIIFPEGIKKSTHRVSVSQLSKEVAVGGITWELRWNLENV
jgi:hypothetical protein